jgi:formate dehydrogenase iron-sulfur subunit
VFGRREILLTEARKRLEKDPTYIQHVYGEKELGGTGVLYISKTPFEDLGFPALPDEALPRTTYGFLSTIPVLHTTLPVVLAGFYLVTRRREDASHVSTGKEAGHDR